jgi:hypothetical protein
MSVFRERSVHLTEEQAEFLWLAMDESIQEHSAEQCAGVDGVFVAHFGMPVETFLVQRFPDGLVMRTPHQSTPAEFLAILVDPYQASGWKSIHVRLESDFLFDLGSFRSFESYISQLKMFSRC